MSHAADCKCTYCLDADMMAFVTEQFGEEFAYSIENDTRYGEIRSPRRIGGGNGNGFGTRKAKRVEMATEPQLNFIRVLFTKKGTELENIELLTKDQASTLIGELKKLPDVRKTQAKREVANIEPGMYAKDGKIYKVKLSNPKPDGVRYPYALELNEAHRFEYAPGVVGTLSAEDRMTEEQAAAYGLEHGVCCVCGRVLTNEDSKARGIGPICATRL